MLKIRSLLFLVVLTALCNFNLACVTPAAPPVATPMLNSERIKQKFGSYGVKVIDSGSSSLRISSLYSTEHDAQVSRTLAITIFASPMDDALLEGHKLIINGGSIGSTFKDLGWALSKENLAIESIEPNQCLLKFMNLTKSQPLALHVYKLFLSKGEHAKLPYAVIAEIHHPDYLSLAEVKQIYGNVSKHADLSPIQSALKNLGC